MHVDRKIKTYFSWGLEIYYLLLRHNHIYVTYKVISSYYTIYQYSNIHSMC